MGIIFLVCRVFGWSLFHFYGLYFYWVHVLKILWVFFSDGIIGTLKSFAWTGICVVFWFFYMMGWCYCYIYGGTTFVGLTWGVALSNILFRDLSVFLWEFPSVTSGFAGAGLFRACIKCCTFWMDGSVDEIFSILYFGDGNSLVSEILSALVFGMYALWNL